MSKPSILFMNRVYPPLRGATGRLLKDLAESFVYEGWEVTVVSSGIKSGEEMINGVRVIRVKADPRPSSALSYMWVWLKILIITLRVKSNDVLVTLSDPPMIIIAGRIVSRIKKSRHINWCQDLYPDVVDALGIKMPKFLMKWFRQQRIKAMKECVKVITCGRCMSQHLAHDGIDLSKIVTIANWADLELIDPDIVEGNVVDSNKTDKKMIRPFEDQIKKDKRFRILYAGNIGLAHPIDVVLDAAKILEDQGSDVEFVFVGDGKRFDYIAQRRSELCLDNISLLPYQPPERLQEIMESGDIHLITMSDDAAGYIVPCKVYTALAVARPCIFVGPLESEVSKIISEFGSGLVVARDDTENLVNAILYFRHSGDDWFEAHSGAIAAREVFNPKASIGAWIRCVRDLQV